MSKQLTEKEETEYLIKVINESVKLTLFDNLIGLQKQLPNDAEFGKEVREILNKLPQWNEK